jgi:flagellar export protein FliJ
MPRPLATLHRLREHARKTAGAELRRAETEHERQQERCDELQRTVAAARGATDESDPASLACYHAFRLQSEVLSRREEARLAQRARDVDARRTRHVVAVRDELALGHVIERREAAETAEEDRKERMGMDEIAARGGGER